MQYYRLHNFPVSADAPLRTTLALVHECLAKAHVVKAPLRFCFIGAPGCSAISGEILRTRELSRDRRIEPVAAENLISGKILGGHIVQSRVGTAARGMRLADLKVAARSSVKMLNLTWPQRAVPACQRRTDTNDEPGQAASRW